MRDWQSIYHDRLLHRATIVRDVLAGRGLNPVLISKMDTLHQLGHYEVQVAPEHVIRSIKIINDEINFE